MNQEPTKLIYMEHMQRFEQAAKIIDIVNINDRQALIVDQTIFYPQGGGQPYDQGTITANGNEFAVEEVRFKDGIVYHIGTITKGSFTPGMDVLLQVDKARRIFNSKNHTAGHLIDIAMRKIGMNLIPTKGYHFPQGAYDEYEGTLDEQERANLAQKLKPAIDQLMKEERQISVKLVSYDELAKLAAHVPDYIPKDKPSRVMIVEGFPAIPCGGTHVATTKEVGVVTIEKVKNKKGNLRISYAIP